MLTVPIMEALLKITMPLTQYSLMYLLHVHRWITELEIPALLIDGRGALDKTLPAMVTLYNLILKISIWLQRTYAVALFIIIAGKRPYFRIINGRKITEAKEASYK